MLQRLIIRGFALILAIAAGQAQAAGQDPLPPDEVFRYSVSVDGDTLVVDWEIEEGYYLYRPKMSFKSGTPGVTLGKPDMPVGKIKEDEFFGKSEVYRGAKTVRIPYTNGSASNAMILELRSQGCADMGLCYPPQNWSAAVTLPVVAAAGSDPVTVLTALGGEPDFGLGGGEFLPPDEAFQFFAQMADDYTVRAYWSIAEGYYLYKSKFSFSGDSTLAQVGQPRLPKGKEKHDEFFGDVEVYYTSAEINLPISRSSPNAGELELTATYQGCAEDGICYPPITRTALIGISTASTTPPSNAPAAAGGAAPAAEQDRLAEFISNGTLWWVLLVFFGLGLGLSVTPCVLPMVPILSGIIAGQGPQITTRQSFILSLVYVLAMAMTYTIAGVVIAMLGQNVQAFFQNPWIIIAFSLVFIALALAMFGVYELQVPGVIQTRLTEFSNRQSGGTLVGVGVMGVLSALIVGPCVAAPLVGVLIFIGQSGDAVRGGLTLFALSLGMGAPLLAFGASAGKLMVKAGGWMNTVKYLFGIMLLGVAIWMLGRVLPPRVTMLLWGALAVGTGVVLGAFSKDTGRGRTSAKIAGIIVLAYGAVLGASAALGGYDPFNPLRGTRWHEEQHLDFERIKSVADLDAAIVAASAAGRPVMLDFYADWCVACKELEKYTFTDPIVLAALGNAQLLQADVTANDADDQALLKRFGVFGPPTVAFFAADGREAPAQRVVGFMQAEEFAQRVEQAFGRR